MTKLFKPSDELIESCLLIRDTHEPRTSVTDFTRWEDLEDIMSYFEGLNFSGGNIFYHERPFDVHTDLFDGIARTTVIIPLEVESDQKLIIFDQSYTDKHYKGSVVWAASVEGEVGSPHCKMVYNRPYESKVEGLTNEACPIELTQDLPEDPDFYFGLTGKSYDWIPGRGFIFDSANLHATGKMSQGKYGLAMWFNNSVEEVYERLKNEN